jgi:hypothetical protein
MQRTTAGRRRHCRLFTLLFGPRGLTRSQILTGIAGIERELKGSIAALEGSGFPGPIIGLATTDESVFRVPGYCCLTTA